MIISIGGGVSLNTLNGQIVNRPGFNPASGAAGATVSGGVVIIPNRWDKGYQVMYQVPNTTTPIRLPLYAYTPHLPQLVGLEYGQSPAKLGPPIEGSQSQAVSGSGRTQSNPQITNRLPMLYGSNFVKGAIVDARISDDNKRMTYVVALGEKCDTTFPVGLTPGAITYEWGDVYMSDQRLNLYNRPVIDSTAGEVWAFNTAQNTTAPNGAFYNDYADKVRVYFYNGSDFPVQQYGAGTDRPKPWEGKYYNKTLTPGVWVGPPVIDGWDDTWKMTNTIFAIIEIVYDADKGLTSLPEFTFNIENNITAPGTVIYDYLTNVRYGAGIDPDKIDVQSFIDLNTLAAQQVSYTDADQTTQTQNRYSLNGIVNTNDTVKNNMDRLLSACNAWLTFNYNQGKWKILTNSAVSQETIDNALSYDDTNIISALNISVSSMEQMYNSVEVSFPNKIYKDRMDLVRVELPQEQRNPLEPEHNMDVSIEFCNNKVQASVLANLFLKQNREDLGLSFTTDFSGLNSEPGDIIKVSNTTYGFDNKLFRVVNVREIEQENSIVVKITAIEYNADVYADEAIENFDLAPNTDIPVWYRSITPPAPLFVSETKRGKLPSFKYLMAIPTGTYDIVEFWYSNNDGATYEKYSEQRPGEGLYAEGQLVYQDFRGFSEGVYLFKVRIGKENIFSDLSPASTTYQWQPIEEAFNPLSNAVDIFPRPVVITQDTVNQVSVVGQEIFIEIRNGLDIIPVSTADNDIDQAENTWRLSSQGKSVSDSILTLSTTIDTLHNAAILTVTHWQYGIDFPVTIQPNLRYKDANGVMSDIQGSVEIYSEKIRTSTQTTIPTYTVSVNSTSRSETTSIDVITTVNTTAVENNTTLYWEIIPVSGTLTAADFVENTLTGSVVITNNQGVFTVNINEDNITEGTESFRIDIFSDSNRNILLAQSNTISIIDSSLNPSMTFPWAINQVFTGTFTLLSAAYLKVGDIAVVFDYHSSEDDALPTGWTLISSSYTAGIAQRLNVYYKELTLSDIGATFTGLSGTNPRKCGFYLRPNFNVGTITSYDLTTESVYEANPSSQTITTNGVTVPPVVIAFAGFAGNTNFSVSWNATNPANQFNGVLSELTGGILRGRAAIYNSTPPADVTASMLRSFPASGDTHAMTTFYLTFEIE